MPHRFVLQPPLLEADSAASWAEVSEVTSPLVPTFPPPIPRDTNGRDGSLVTSNPLEIAEKSGREAITTEVMNQALILVSLPCCVKA